MAKSETIDLYRGILELAALAKKFADEADGPERRSYATTSSMLTRAAEKIAGLNDTIDIDLVLSQVVR